MNACRSGSWLGVRLEARKELWEEAKSILLDRAIEDSEESHDMFTIDARCASSSSSSSSSSAAASPSLSPLLLTPRPSMTSLTFVSLSLPLPQALWQHRAVSQPQLRPQPGHPDGLLRVAGRAHPTHRFLRQCRHRRYSPTPPLADRHHPRSV